MTQTTVPSGTASSGSAGATLTRAELEPRLEQHRRELTGYCYRMLGSAFDAEDAVQETMVRAWRSAEKFEGRSGLRTWLYRIATNVCLDMLGSRQRRALPIDLSPTAWQPVESSLRAERPHEAWVEPMPDARTLNETGDPAELAETRESVRLAFVAALQQLPPRQRVVLLLREVLRWKADEVATLLDTTTASVNSALQRARATLASAENTSAEVRVDPLDDQVRELLARYVDAFERYDMTALVALLHEDATQNMPPFEMWLRGREDLVAWMTGPGSGCEGSRCLSLEVNGSPAFAQYKPDGDAFSPWGIHVLDVTGGRVTGITTFLDTRLFELFGLPADPTG